MKPRARFPPFEAVWCVFDVENPHHNQSFDRAVFLADQNGYQLAVSNPAFEFWYVLHFERTTRPFANGDELKEYLRRHIPGYYPALPVLTAWWLQRKLLYGMPIAFQRIIRMVGSVFRTHLRGCICW
jgi:hypothetical protein